jgi:hypothetical protein
MNVSHLNEWQDSEIKWRRSGVYALFSGLLYLPGGSEKKQAQHRGRVVGHLSEIVTQALRNTEQQCSQLNADIFVPLSTNLNPLNIISYNSTATLSTHTYIAALCESLVSLDFKTHYVVGLIQFAS